MRGKLVSINQLTIVVGILVAQLVNWWLVRDLGASIEVALGADATAAAKDEFIRNSWFGQTGWRWMFALTALPSILFFIGMLLVPESPRWLLQRGRSSEASKTLSRIGGPEYAAAAVSEIHSALDSEKLAQSGLREVFSPGMGRILVLGITLAVHPGRQITPTTIPELAEAAKISMNARGDASTGWSRAWKMCVWARLQDGDRAHRIMSSMIKTSFTPNLLATHPPFQIDANFGYAAGVCEMLLQRQAGEIQLLPALPKAWPEGKVTGLRARGGFTVDIEWKDCKVTNYRIAAKEAKPVQVRVNGEAKTINTEVLN